MLLGTENQSNEDTINDALKEVISSMSEVPLSTFKHLVRTCGFDHGPCYCLVRKIWRKDDEAVCVLEYNGPFNEEIPFYIIHPAFIDACFQVMSISVHYISNKLCHCFIFIG